MTCLGTHRKVIGEIAQARCLPADDTEGGPEPGSRASGLGTKKTKKVAEMMRVIFAAPQEMRILWTSTNASGGSLLLSFFAPKSFFLSILGWMGKKNRKILSPGLRFAL